MARVKSLYCVVLLALIATGCKFITPWSKTKDTEISPGPETPRDKQGWVANIGCELPVKEKLAATDGASAIGESCVLYAPTQNTMDEVRIYETRCADLKERESPIKVFYLPKIKRWSASQDFYHRGENGKFVSMGKISALPVISGKVLRRPADKTACNLDIGMRELSLSTLCKDEFDQMHQRTIVRCTIVKDDRNTRVVGFKVKPVPQNDGLLTEAEIIRDLDASPPLGPIVGDTSPMPGAKFVKIKANQFAMGYNDRENPTFNHFEYWKSKITDNPQSKLCTDTNWKPRFCVSPSQCRANTKDCWQKEHSFENFLNIFTSSGSAKLDPDGNPRRALCITQRRWTVLPGYQFCGIDSDTFDFLWWSRNDAQEGNPRPITITKDFEMMESPLTWRNVYAILGAITPHTRRIKDTVSDEDLGLVKLNVELDTYSEKCDESQLVTGFKTGVFNSVCLDEVFKVSPSTNPSDYSAQVFDLLVAELNRIDSHHTYSLASEAEWELAARSKSDGTVETANFPAQWGIDCPSTRHNLGALASVYMENKPNGAGLLRMASPIPEITGDKFIPDYFEKANAADPRTSGANGTNNTVRNASKLEQDIGTKSNALCYTHAFGVRRPIMERTPFDMETVTARLIRRPK